MYSFKRSKDHTPAQLEILDAVADACRSDGELVPDRIRALTSAELREFDRADTMLVYHPPPLEYALKARKWPLCDALVANGADPNNCLISCAMSNDRIALEHLKSYMNLDFESRKHSMFVHAALEGHFELADELLALGANVHHKLRNSPWEETALFTAAVTGKTDVVRWLLCHGADANVNREKIIEVTKQRGLDETHAIFV